MDSFSNDSYGRESHRMGQQDNFGPSTGMGRNDREGFGSSGAGRDYNDNYNSSRRDDYGGSSNMSSGFSGGNDSGFGGRRENYDSGFGGRREHNDSYGAGNMGGGFDSGSHRHNNEYGSGRSEHGASSSSKHGGQKESFGDKMIDKAAQYAKNKW